MNIEVIASKRDLRGKGASRRLRHAGRVPGVLYGAESGAVAIELDHKALYYGLKQEAFHASILTLNLDGKKEPVLLRDAQLHPFKPLVMHVDFQRVASDHEIHVKVPLHFVNGDIAPGVKLAGGTVSHIMTEVDVACLPKDLPEFIEVDLADMEAGHSIHLSELKLPAGVEATALSKGGDDLPVVTIPTPRGGLGAAADETAEEGEAEA